MSFESFAHVLITEEFLRHVWEGEKDLTTGGHRFGLGREGKSEFPEHWDIHVVEQAIRRVLDQPQAVLDQGSRIHCLRQVGDVIVRASIDVQGVDDVLISAYPVCGVGVHLNVRGRHVLLPLDFTVLET